MKKSYRTSELSIVKDIVFSAFEQLEKKTDCRIPKGFFIILMLFLGIKGRINFLQLERFSNRCESGFRYFFEKRFSFMKFNQALTKLHIKGKTALAFEPSYISKAGKKTPWIGYFWSGCAGKAKWGMEFCGFAVIDMTRRTAFHLTGFQTIDLMENVNAVSALFDKIGNGILVTHSHSGGQGWLTVIKNDNIKGVVSYESGSGFVFPQGETPEPMQSSAGVLEAVGIPKEDFLKLTKIPIVIYYGDFIPETPSDNHGTDNWRTRLAMAKLFCNTINKYGGNASVVHLPEIGIRGNTHFPISDLNNVQIADHTAD